MALYYNEPIQLEDMNFVHCTLPKLDTFNDHLRHVEGIVYR